MPRASKIIKCVDCGHEFPRKELNRNFRCQQCAWHAFSTVMSQMYKKEGYFYEKWKAKTKAAMEKL